MNSKTFKYPKLPYCHIDIDFKMELSIKNVKCGKLWKHKKIINRVLKITIAT